MSMNQKREDVSREFSSFPQSRSTVFSAVHHACQAEMGEPQHGLKFAILYPLEPKEPRVGPRTPDTIPHLLSDT